MFFNLSRLSMYKETNSRALVKTLTYRGLGSLAMMTVIYFMTDKMELAALVGGADMIIKLTMYYLHERIWDKIKFGRKEYKPFTILFTGLPNSGKSILADEIYHYFQKRHLKVERLDGDDVRTLFPLQGFTREERDAYLKRMAFFASILQKNGVSVVASFIAPFRESRDYMRKMCKDNFIEVYVATPLEYCEKTDEWGMYEKARKGEIQNFVGVHEPYEPPLNPEVTVDLSKESKTEAIKKILRHMRKNSLGN